MKYVLGVDGGNTKTVALVSSIEGTIVGCGRGGCGDIYNAASADAALDALSAAVTQALRQAGVEPSQLQAAVFSTAGADWPEDNQFIADQLRARGLVEPLTVVNDALGALRAGSPDGTGVIVACGTGAAVGARAAGGESWHASFWLSDLGALALGRNALDRVYTAELGLDDPTQLTARILAFYQLDSVEQLLHQFTSRTGVHPRNAASLARLVLDVAQEADPAAISLVLTHGKQLGNYATVAARKVGLSGRRCFLVLAGGLFRHPSHLLVEAIVDRARRALPELEPIQSRLEPVAGALMLALEEAGISVDDQVLARLSRSMPPPSYFAT